LGYYPFEKGLVDNGTVKWVRGFTPTHDGEDWGMPVGTPLHSPEEGTITQVGKDKFGGYWLYVLFKSGYRFLFVHISRDVLGTDYYHMTKDSSKTVSKAVKAFELVCYSGNTGNSTGPHLHHELRDTSNKSINPKPHLTYYNSTSMAQWCIDRAIRDAAASNMDGFLNRHRKDVKDAGVDPVEWWVRNGSAEVPAMYEKVIATRDQLQKEVPTLNETIAKLNSSIGGLTTDRNKFKSFSEELSTKLDAEKLERQRIENELIEAQKELKKINLLYAIEVEDHGRCIDKVQPLINENEHMKAVIGTQATQIKRLTEALVKKEEGKKSINWKRLIAKAILKLKEFLKKKN